MDNHLAHRIETRQTQVHPVVLEELVHEAALSRDAAAFVEKLDYHLDSDNGLHGPLRAHVSGPGQALSGFHEGSA